MIAAARTATALACQSMCIVTRTRLNATFHFPSSLLVTARPRCVPVSCRHRTKPVLLLLLLLCFRARQCWTGARHGATVCTFRVVVVCFEGVLRYWWGVPLCGSAHLFQCFRWWVVVAAAGFVVSRRCEQCVVFIFFYIYGFVKHALNVCKCLCLSMFLFFMMLFQSK